MLRDESGVDSQSFSKRGKKLRMQFGSASAGIPQNDIKNFNIRMMPANTVFDFL
jgi:hypothetical protein